MVAAGVDGAEELVVVVLSELPPKAPFKSASKFRRFFESLVDVAGADDGVAGAEELVPVLLSESLPKRSFTAPATSGFFFESSVADAGVDDGVAGAGAGDESSSMVDVTALSVGSAPKRVEVVRVWR